MSHLHQLGWYYYGMDINKRFDAYVSPPDSDGCWLWTGGVTNGGYGRFRLNGSTVMAHRYSFSREHGPIPAGMYVLHRCDVPACVRPDHLFLGSLKTNTQDMIAKGRKRQVRGESHGRSKITEQTVVAIRAATGTQMEIAERFGVTQPLVSMIRSKKIWSHV